MNFWQQLQPAFQANSTLLRVTPLFILVAFALFALLPRERSRIRTAIILYILGLVGLAIAATLVGRGVSVDASVYRWTRWASLLLQGIAFISVASIFIFDILLAALRLRPPRILRDLILALAYIVVAVDFRYSPTDVINAVENALRAEPIPNVAGNPPDCVFKDFQESYARYSVRYWLTDLAADDPTSSVVRTRVYFALRRANIPFSIPAQSLFGTEDDASRRDRKAREETNLRREAIRRVELFQTLTEDEVNLLAASLKFAPFVRGEAMTRQGAEAHWLYLITKGEAEVRLAIDSGGASEKVATLRQGVSSVRWD
jgi:hypothetical protein